MLNIAKLLNLNIPLVLASQSPRRKKLLEQLGFEFTIIPSDVDEDEHNSRLQPQVFVETLSLKKARDVASKLPDHALVLGADTIVVIDSKILNKPTDKEDAIRMLEILSGRTHIVYTGIALVETGSGRDITRFQNTKVTFRKLSKIEIEAYVDSGSPMDKAGAYGIQDDFGAVFVSNISGCYYNIVGLPLELLYQTIKEFTS